MLESFRKASKTWIVKLLFAMLTLSFMAWGVGDVVRRGAFGTDPAIAVGDTAYSAADVNAEFKREMDRLQPMFGGKLTPEEARKLGLMDRTIDAMVSRTLIDDAASTLGLAVSDAAVRQAVTADPNLRDERGEFDRQRLDRALARMGLSEAAFLRRQRSALVRSQMAASLSGGVTAPAALVDPLVRRREEQRVAETITVADASVPAPAAPDDAALSAYYKEHSDRFMAPEMRALTVLLLRAADVAAGIEVTDEMVQDAFQQRQDEFAVPERRQVAQVIVTSQAEADKAAAQVKAGKDLTAVAKAVGQPVIDLGTVERKDLPAELADSVFAQAPGSVAPPVRTDLGWHVVRVVSVVPGRNRTLDDVRPQLVQDIRRDKAIDQLNTLSNKVDDALGGGASLEEAGQRFGLQVLKVAAVDAKGLGPDGKPVAGIPAAESFLDVAFRSDPGTESQLTENGSDGYFMLRVDSVTPPAPKPFAAVKAEVAAGWAAEKRHTLAQERAEALARQITAGTPAAKAAKAAGLSVVPSAPFTREAQDGAALPPAIIAAMFDGAPGHVATAATPKGWMVARLSRVVPFDPAQHTDMVAATRRSLSQSVAGDLVDQYLAALNTKAGVKIDRSQLAREE